MLASICCVLIYTDKLLIFMKTYPFFSGRWEESEENGELETVFSSHSESVLKEESKVTFHISLLFCN